MKRREKVKTSNKAENSEGWKSQKKLKRKHRKRKAGTRKSTK